MKKKIPYNILITSDQAGADVYVAATTISKILQLPLFSVSIMMRLLAQEHFGNLPSFSLVNAYLADPDIARFTKEYGMLSDSDFAYFNQAVNPGRELMDLYMDIHSLRALKKGGWVLDGKLLSYILFEYDKTSPKRRKIKFSPLISEGIKDLNTVRKQTAIIYLTRARKERIVRMQHRYQFGRGKQAKLSLQKAEKVLDSAEERLASYAEKSFGITMGSGDKYVDTTIDATTMKFDLLVTRIIDFLENGYFSSPQEMKKLYGNYRSRVRKETVDSIYKYHLKEIE